MRKKLSRNTPKHVNGMNELIQTRNVFLNTYKVPKKNENGQWEQVDEIVKGDLILFDTYEEYLD